MRRHLSILIVLIVVAVTGVSAQARWYDLYDEARKHIQNADYKSAEAKLLLARKLNPRSGRNVLRYGGWRDDYFPEFYLGYVALFTDRPELAVSLFDQARKANINAQDDEFRQLADLETRSRKLVAEKNTPPPAPPPTPPVNVEKKDPIPAPVVEKPAPTGPIVPARNYRQEFGELEKRAREQLNRQNFDESSALATEAIGIAVAGSLPDLRTAGENLLREIERGRLARNADDALKARDAARSRQAIEALASRFPEYAVTPLRDRLTALERELRVAVLYKDAMRAFFVGNHARALETIAQIEAAGPLTARGHFYRACSLASQAAATTDPDSDRRLNDALRSYKQAAAGRRQFEQDLRYISPKIQTLLGITRR